ncbi:hypothetical protein [Lentzea sp. NPDC092896]|uniref:hypothetical protein n=1 Tax=Lentzea sp. NPDC092896 TaxID=3364127 RepID=UPI00382B40FA
MSQLVDRTITVLRAEHEVLAGLVRTFTDDLTAPVSVAMPGAGLVIDDAVTVVDRLEAPFRTLDDLAERLAAARLAEYDEADQHHLSVEQAVARCIAGEFAAD